VHEVLGRHEAGDASLHVGVAIGCLRVETVGAEVGDVGHPVVVRRMSFALMSWWMMGVCASSCRYSSPRATPNTTSCRCGLFAIVRLVPASTI
jgi:hypothetical protein